MTTRSYREFSISQLPAIKTLMNLGYKYISRKEAKRQRNNNLSNVILEDILRERLVAINEFKYKGQAHKFSNNNIEKAITKLKDVEIHKGLLINNRDIFNNFLMSGKSFDEVIDGDKKSYTLNYIDWDNVENNVFHITDEFIVERTRSKNTERPDIVLFINGMPICVIECKRPDEEDSINQSIEQFMRNQSDEHIPHLFVYSQLLLAIHSNEVKYATTYTPKKFWSVWREELAEDIKKEVINKELSQCDIDAIFENTNEQSEKYNINKHRLPTIQDENLINLCHPARLLDLIKRFIVFDDGIKKIARYQQYFAIQEILKTIKDVDPRGCRNGGVIWHTQGSGKSLTMVMLAKAIQGDSDIQNPRMIIVTDRIDLDKQITDTFRDCDVEPQKATSGTDLIKLLSNPNNSVITTVINKFHSAMNSVSFRDEDKNIFVLVDEGHRSQHGESHALMRKSLPNACFIGLTGTPLMKEQKNTRERFGKYIHEYTIKEAVDDQAVVPILYEGRLAELEINSEILDKWFDRMSQNLSSEQIVDLKRKYSKERQLADTKQRLELIAYDIAEHFKNHWQGLEGGFKGQIVTNSKSQAIKLKNYLDNIGGINSEVLISPPDVREGSEEVNQEDIADENNIQFFWKKMMQQYGTAKAYDEDLIQAFKEGPKPELIIVVDKLLTGFDAPCNTVLYLIRKLKNHNLLQAIARVNRLHGGKEYGYIIDYEGNLKNLDEALDIYSNLNAFDKDEVQDTVQSVCYEINRVKDLHSNLVNMFASIQNKSDNEEIERYLADEKTRHDFYDNLRAFAKCLRVAFSTVIFFERFKESEINKFKQDLSFYEKLRKSVKLRYAESIDFSDYENKMKNLLDNHVIAKDIKQLNAEFNIFDEEAMNSFMNSNQNISAKADTIAHQTKSIIDIKLDNHEDPAFYQKLSKLIEQAIDDYQKQRISEQQYLIRVNKIKDTLINRTDETVPNEIQNHSLTRAIWGLINRKKIATDQSSTIIAMSQEIADILQDHATVDWQGNIDTINLVKNNIELLFYSYKSKLDLDLSIDLIDELLDQIIDVAYEHLR